MRMIIGFSFALLTLLTGLVGLVTAGESLAAVEPLEVKIEVGDSLKYSTNQIKVSKGAQVKLTLTHTGKLPKSAMGHNFVLLAQGVDKSKFATKAMAAADNDYIPKSMADKVIAHTKLIGGGESDTITFEAPPPGEYTFLCSFPGHYTVMNGKLVVE